MLGTSALLIEEVKQGGASISFVFTFMLGKFLFLLINKLYTHDRYKQLHGSQVAAANQDSQHSGGVGPSNVVKTLRTCNYFRGVVGIITIVFVVPRPRNS